MLTRSFVNLLNKTTKYGNIQLRRSTTKSQTDEEILNLMVSKKIKLHQLESILAPDFHRAVRIRREFIKLYMMQHHAEDKAVLFEKLPHENFDYSKIYGANCENVVGYIPIPVGVAGPILVDGVEYPIPMATTEGALVASTHRGARALSESGGVTTIITEDGMTRGPVVALPSLKRALEVKQWVERDHYEEVSNIFNGTSRFAKLSSIKVGVVGRKLFMRFKSFTGDAMGMNMVTKGVSAVMDKLIEEFPDMQVISVSGNYCIDKKPSAMNWVEGRGKSVVAEALVTKDIVERVLKTKASALVKLNVDKNLVGSAMAGSIGGFNAHAANVVSAMFIATGQDPAHVVASSNCINLMEDWDGDLYFSIAMPTVEVGTIGGGTDLDAQRTMLQIIGVQGSHPTQPGLNSSTLARVVCASVMAAELSLMAGLATGHLTEAHMKLNRKKNS